MRYNKNVVYVMLLFVMMATRVTSAFTVEKSWERQFDSESVYMYKVATDGSHIGIISLTGDQLNKSLSGIEYYILDANGNRVIGGKNRSFQTLEVSSDQFILFINKNKVYDYKGNYLWSTELKSLSEFSPGGNYIFFFEDNYFNPETGLKGELYSKDGLLLKEFKLDYDFYGRFKFSDDEKFLYVLTEGVFYLEDEKVTKILNLDILGDHLKSVDFITKEKFIIANSTDNNKNCYLRLFDQTGDLMWERTFEGYFKVQSFQDRIFLLGDSLITLDLEGNVIREDSSYNRKDFVFSGKLEGKDLLFLRSRKKNELLFLDKELKLLTKFSLPYNGYIYVNPKLDLMYLTSKEVITAYKLRY